MQHNNAPQKMKPSTNTMNGNKMSANNKPKTMLDDDLYGHNLSANPYNWTEEEVVAWIKHIGYAQYMDLFHEQHVNGEALLALTKDEFGQIGIYALGHTKNILSKIEKLKKFAAKFKPKDPYNDNDVVCTFISSKTHSNYKTTKRNHSPHHILLINAIIGHRIQKHVCFLHIAFCS